jgi:hypothetical protein
VPDIAAFHLLSDIDGTIDRIGPGTAQVGWNVIGKAGSEDFSMTRTNRYADTFDISFASIFELLDQLFAVTENRFSEVTFATVRLTATIGSAFREYRVEGLERRDAGEWVPVDADAPLEVMPGSTLRIRVILSAYRDAAPAPVELSIAIPDAAGLETFLSVTGGGSGGEDGEEGGGPEPSSFDELIAQLEDAPRNDEIVAELGFGGEEGGGGEPLASVQKRVAEVVTGSVGVPVIVLGGEPGEPEPEEPPGPGGELPEPELPPEPGGEAPAFDVLGASKMRLGRALRRGIRLTVQTAEPGVLTLRASVNRRTARRLDLAKRVVGTLVRRLDAGENRVRLMLSRSARRHLRRANRVALTLRATFRSDSGIQRASGRVVLRRMKA